MTAPTGKPSDIRNLAPAEPPRPEKAHYFIRFAYITSCADDRNGGQTRVRSANERTSDERQGVDATGRPAHAHTHFCRFGRREIISYCELKKNDLPLLDIVVCYTIASKKKYERHESSLENGVNTHEIT